MFEPMSKKASQFNDEELVSREELDKISKENK
jgi:hypothetical protein